MRWLRRMLGWERQCPDRLDRLEREVREESRQARAQQVRASEDQVRARALARALEDVRRENHFSEALRLTFGGKA